MQGNKKMKKRKVMLIASVSIFLQSVSSLSSIKAQEPFDRSRPYWAIANRSCAAWLSSTVTKATGEHWIGGFWTALNSVNPNTIMRMTGNHTDNPGIMGEIEKICRERPSMDLIIAVSEVYDKFSFLARPHRH